MMKFEKKVIFFLPVQTEGVSLILINIMNINCLFKMFEVFYAPPPTLLQERDWHLELPLSVRPKFFLFRDKGGKVGTSVP